MLLLSPSLAREHHPEISTSIAEQCCRSPLPAPEFYDQIHGSDRRDRKHNESFRNGGFHVLCLSCASIIPVLCRQTSAETRDLQYDQSV